jgi:tetratricopeptide (TPR) repeat protein
VIHNDPWSPWPHARLAWAHHLDGDATASVQLAHAALERFPHHEGTQLYGATILAFNGETNRAVEIANRLVQRLPYLDLSLSVQAYTLAMDGRHEEAHSILEQLEWFSRERYVLKTFSPAVYVALGQYEKALADLRWSDQSRCPWFFQMLADPRLRPLHGLEEFQSMRGTLSAMEAEA